MTRTVTIAAVAAALGLIFFLGSPAGAQSATLSVGVGTPVTDLSFDLTSDPVALPQAPASPASFTVNVTTNAVANWVLTVEATNQYLDTSTRSIDCRNISWSATGTSYRNGVLSASSAQTVAAAAGSGSWDGTLSFEIANLWTYVSGSYSDTIVYTLTAI
jgi:hypothetical protein